MAAGCSGREASLRRHHARDTRRRVALRRSTGHRLATGRALRARALAGNRGAPAAALRTGRERRRHARLRAGQRLRSLPRCCRKGARHADRCPSARAAHHAHDRRGCLRRGSRRLPARGAGPRRPAARAGALRHRRGSARRRLRALRLRRPALRIHRPVGQPAALRPPPRPLAAPVRGIDRAQPFHRHPAQSGQQHQQPDLADRAQRGGARPAPAAAALRRPIRNNAGSTDGPGKLGGEAGPNRGRTAHRRPHVAADRRRGLFHGAGRGHPRCQYLDRHPGLHLRRRRLRAEDRRPAQGALARGPRARADRPPRLDDGRPGAVALALLLAGTAAGLDRRLPAPRLGDRGARPRQPLADFRPHQADRRRRRARLCRGHEHRPRIPL